MNKDKTIDELVDEQFENFRRMLLHQRTFMLSGGCSLSEAFIVNSFKNILDAYSALHATVKVIRK